MIGDSQNLHMLNPTLPSSSIPRSMPLGSCICGRRASSSVMATATVPAAYLVFTSLAEGGRVNVKSQGSTDDFLSMLQKGLDDILNPPIRLRGDSAALAAPASWFAEPGRMLAPCPARGPGRLVCPILRPRDMVPPLIRR